ncbi:MAG TPA: DUF4145 domain-containing protein [Anaerolineae bacterium]|nr:DUF4145 domain-containing protein [Anaerolineae bacterium]
MMDETFIVDCPRCKAKVAAIVSGVAEKSGRWHGTDEPFADKVYVGKCPRCETLLCGKSHQISFEGWDSEFDEWSDVVRVYPEPIRTFSSDRIPKVVKASLAEADLCLQSGAPTAACVMFGRALEAVCRDILQADNRDIFPKIGKKSELKPQKTEKMIMLGEGINELKNRNVIDQRLYDWSQQLQAFRNIAAHPDGIDISREDAGDLQSFVYAIVEYIYDLTERYEEFKSRIARRKTNN